MNFFKNTHKKIANVLIVLLVIAVSFALSTACSSDSKSTTESYNISIHFSRIAYSAYSGTHSVLGLGNDLNWLAPAVILQKDTTITGIKNCDSNDIGKVIAIGEPTVATVNGKELLYFVYGYIRGVDSITDIIDIDMQAGFIEKK